MIAVVGGAVVAVAVVAVDIDWAIISVKDLDLCLGFEFGLVGRNETTTTAVVVVVGQPAIRPNAPDHRISLVWPIPKRVHRSFASHRQNIISVQPEW